jgi:signal peptidase I
MAGLFKRLTFGANLRRTLIRAGVLVVLTVLVVRFVLAPIRLDGTSMEPTFTHGQVA